MPQASAADERQRTRKGRWQMLLVLACCAAPVVASYLTYFVIRPEGRNNYAELIQPSRSLPETLSLSRLDGVAVRAADLRKQWLLVVVGSGDCGSACEQGLYMQRQIHQMLGKERARLDKIWLITDAAPPKPALLQAVAAGAEPAQALRVSPDALARWLKPAAGQTLDAHFYIVDPMGEWMMRAPARADPMRLKKDLERLLRASASWDSAGR